ncbi:MAG TPA: hypothetical protein VMU22_01020 [Rhizomicrobium sp.]|nr:hypothetical protein [Rhizomicrobium sp.]
MTRIVPRMLYAAAATIFLFGGLAHAAVYFRKAGADIGTSSLKLFTQTELKALWLCDSTTLSALAILFFYLAARPTSADRAVVSLIALVPAGTTFLLYAFLGAFYAAHLLLAATVMIAAASFFQPDANRALSPVAT